MPLCQRQQTVDPSSTANHNIWRGDDKVKLDKTTMSFASIAKAAAQDKQVSFEGHSPPNVDKGSIAVVADELESANVRANGHQDHVIDHSSHPDIEKNNEFAHLSINTLASVAKFAEKMPHQDYKDVLSFSEVHRTGTFFTLVVPLVVVLGALLVPAYCVPLIVDGEVPTAKIFLPVGMACLVVFPLLIFLKWIGRLMLDSFDFDDHFAEIETGGRFDCLKPSVPLSCLSLAILLRQANYLVDTSWADTPYSDFYKLLLNLGTAMSFFIASISGLDSLHQSVDKFGRRLDGLARNKRSHKWYMIMKQSRSFQDKEKDGSARIPGGHRR